jgi:hypothetical protein
MQSLPIAYVAEKERPPYLKVYGRRKPVIKRVTQVRPFYPKVLMPVQAEGYLKQREVDCW